MTEGPILKKLFKFMIPLCIINVTQVLYNAIDVAILGNVTGDDAVAAVGATGSIVALLWAFFNGLANGLTVVASRAVGSKNPDRAREATGTAFVTGGIIGIVVMAAAFPLAGTVLTWMNCDPAVLDQSTTYLRMILLSLPLQFLYNFLAAAMRAAGNSSRPMRIMLIAGACKVGFNIIFLSGLKMGVEGAGLSTMLSQTIAFALALVHVLRAGEAAYNLQRRYLRINGSLLGQIVRFGLPGGLSGVFFYTASAIMSSAINSMGKTVMASNSVASQFDNFVYTVGAAVAASAMAFVGQNIGARKLDRIKKGLATACMLATVLSLTVGVFCVIFARPLCGLITDNPEVIEIARGRIIINSLTFFLSSIMETLSFSLSSMGYYKNHAFVGFFVGLCGRAAWIRLIWPTFGPMANLSTLMMGVPITALIAITEYLIVLNRAAIPGLRKRFAEEEAAAAAE